MGQQMTSGEPRGATAGRRHGAQTLLAVAPALAASFVLSAALLASLPAAAATYKWVDENGVVHYTDRVPPEAINRGNVELNKQGVPVRKTEPALTPEQRRAKAAEDEKRRQQEKQQAEAERRDFALLASYTSENEIDLSRQRALATIEAVLTSSQAFHEQLTRRKAELEMQRAGYQGKPVPLALEREYQGVLIELDRQTELVKGKKSEYTATAARYDADRARWRELSAAGRTAPDAAGGASPAAAPVSPAAAAATKPSPSAPPPRK
jgi:hypothetical protein